MKHILKISLFIALLLYPLNENWGATLFDPKLKWCTLETKHFSIHYHQRELRLAKEAAIIAEDVHERLVPIMRWKPRHKTQIVLADVADYANGFANAFPDNTIIIYVSQPYNWREALSYDNWLRTIITHEYTHILHINTVHGIPKLLRYCFGRIILPNVLQPIWLIEGFAVHNETRETMGGRARGAFYDMMLRMAALEGKFNTIDQASTYPVSWPGSAVPYLYGAMFYKYLADGYGEHKLTEYSHKYSSELPFAIDATAKKVFNKSYDRLWDDWKKYLRRKYWEQKREIGNRPITKSLPITRRGYSIQSPTYSPDGKHIAYIESNPNGYPSLRLMNSNGSHDRCLLKAIVNPSISWSSDSRKILFSQLEVQRNFYEYSDIYSFDIKTKRLRRLTTGWRARDPVYFPTGRKILFVTNWLGTNNLAMMDADGSNITFLTHNLDHTQYFLPRFSPDGNKLVLSVWRAEGFQDICLMDFDSKKLSSITYDRALDFSPCWSPDGNYVLFSSDRSGIFNIYAYSLIDKKIYQVTNVLGGAFAPSVSPDGKEIAFLSYSARGFNIHLMDFNPKSWWEAPPYVDRLPNLVYETSKVRYRIHRYNPIPTLLPKAWLPLILPADNGINIGVLTGGRDVLQKHAFMFWSLYDPKERELSYNLIYLNNQFYPQIEFDLLGMRTSFDGGSRFNYPDTMGMSVTFPLRGTKLRQSLSIGYQRRKVLAGNLGGIRLAWVFTNAKKYGFSISKVDGRRISLSYERTDKFLYSDFGSQKCVFGWQEYYGLPIRHHVLAGKISIGVAFGDTAVTKDAFRLGGHMGKFYLRGYPKSKFEGDKLLIGTLEYRFPIRWIERGIGTWPIFIKNVHGTIFLDYGNVWVGNTIPFYKEFKRSVGCELCSDLTLFYGFVPLTLRVGLALNKESKKKPYLAIGASF